MKDANPSSQLANKLSRFDQAVWGRLPETIRRVSVEYKKADKKTRQQIVNNLQDTISGHALTLIGICKGEELEDVLFDLDWEKRASVQKDLKAWIGIVSSEFKRHFPQNKDEIARRLESRRFFCTGQDWWASRMLVNKAIRLLRNIARNQKKDGQGEKITKDEANVRARQLLKETPTWNWTCRKLAKLIPCPLAWIPYLPVWRAYHEKRKELQRNKTINTVSLSDELEAVLGEGEKDEVLKQLIAEQEGEDREDARRARLYLNRQKKAKRKRK